MSIVGTSAGLLFKIDGDARGLQNELRAVDAGISQLGSQFNSLAGIASVGAVAVGAIATAAVAAGARIFDLTSRVAASGSAIQDLADQTNLSAMSISGLKYAAEQSGTSLETITKGLNRFNVQLGEASSGNDKIAKKLQDLGVTATDTETAFNQLVVKIQNTTDANQQLAIAVEALGKKSGPELVTMIRQGSGSLDDMRATVKRLGIGFDEDGARKAKQFDDQLVELKAVAEGVGIQFATQLMPQMTSAMKTISQAMTDNQETVREWGQAVSDTMYGASAVAKGISDLMVANLRILSLGLLDNQQAWEVWGAIVKSVIRGVLAVATVGISEILIALNALGSYLNSTVGASMGGGVNLPDTAPQVSPKRGGGRGGRRRGGDTADTARSAAEKAERDRIRVIMQNMQDELTLRQATDKRLMAQLDAQLAREEITEAESLKKRRLIILAQLEFQRRAMSDTADLIGKGADEYERIQRQLAVLDEEITAARLEQTTKVYLHQKAAAEKIAAETQAIFTTLQKELIAINDERQSNYITSEESAWDQLIANYSGMLQEQNRLRGDASAAMELILTNEMNRQLARLDDEKKERLKAAAEAIADKEKLEQAKLEIEELYLQRSLLVQEDFQKRIKGIRDKYAIGVPDIQTFGDALLESSMQWLSDLPLDILDQFANSIGQVVSNFILLGEAGPNAMRKLTAQILASVAAQAAVLAIKHLAFGIAALTPWGAIEYGPAAAQFKAAALFGSIALGAGVAGRAVAGNAFKDQSSAATGTGGGADQPSNLSGQNSAFRGFGNADGVGNRLISTLDRVNATLAVVENTQDQFNRKVLGMSPSDVVVLGANGAAPAIRSAYESELGSDTSATDAFMRRVGLVR